MSSPPTSAPAIAAPLPVTPAPRETDRWVEGLRGLAALLVALEHILGMGLLFPKERIPSGILMWGAGHVSVLVFFLLSGYVIGLTNTGAATSGKARHYLARRAIRLLPIFWIALLFTFLAYPQFQLANYLPSLFLLQNYDIAFLKPPYANGPMWSLNYEVLYYLLFLVLWWRPDWLKPSLLGALALGVAGWLLPRELLPRFLPSYATGWIFWAAGWWLSRRPQQEGPPGEPLLAGALALIAIHHLNSGMILLAGLGLKQIDPGFVNLSNLAMLPCCLTLVAWVARRTFPFQRAVAALAFGIPLATALLLLATGRLVANYHAIPEWTTGAILSVLAVALLGLRHNGWLQKLHPLGRISYAFYLVHMPMIFGLSAWGLSATTAPGFALVAILWFGLSIGLAMLLELWLQPRFRRWFALPARGPSPS